MQVEDIQKIEPDASLETDLAIVGSGPAGLSIARQFIGTDVRVMVLESGGLAEEPQITLLNEIENVGAPRYMDPRNVRNRVFGGSSHTWAGKCATFDAIDFETRDWIPYSGWPIKRSDMDGYIERAGRHMYLGPNIYDGSLWPQLGRKAPDPDVDPHLLRSFFWQFSRSPDRAMEYLRFGPEFLKLDAPNIRVFTNATVTHIDTDQSGRELRSLEISATPAHKISVKPSIVVLCGGAIENARLLLASNRILPRGVGNESDVVGRFLMDHPRTSLGDFTGEAMRAIQARFGLFQLKKSGATHFYTHGLALSADLQRKERLLNCAAYLSEHRSADDPWDAMKRLYTRQSSNVLGDAISVASSPGLLLEGFRERVVKGRNVAHKLEKLVIDCLVEQVPDPESRLTLSAKLDPFGVPMPRLHWKISEMEKYSVMRLAHLLASEVDRLGFGRPTLVDWIRERRPESATFTDMAHPAGTTRMSDDPKQGVVDRNCRLHGVDGFYVAGSSVFPTAGHANPTLMIVAMAIRLADHLKERLRRGAR